MFKDEQSNGETSMKNLKFSINTDLLEKFNPDGIGPDHKPAAQFMREYVKRAHEYKNTVRSLERTRREQFCDYIQTLDPKIAVLRMQADKACAKVDALFDVAKEDRVKKRSRLYSTELDEAIKSAKADRSSAWDALKVVVSPYYRKISDFRKSCEQEIRPENYATLGPHLQKPYRRKVLDRLAEHGIAFELQYDIAIKTLAETFEDLGAGTRGIVDQSLKKIKKGPPPRDLAFDGRGVFGLQITKKKGRYISFGEMCAGIATVVKIGIPVEDGIVQCASDDPIVSCFGRTQRELRHEAYRERLERECASGVHVRRKSKWVKLRIVTLHLGGNPKQVVNLPVIFHRPVDPDAVVSYVKVIATRIGGDYCYDLMLTVESESVRRQSGSGIVCVSLGANLVNRDTADTLSAISSYGAGGEVTEGDMRVGAVLGGLDELPLGDEFDKYWGEHVSLTNLNSNEHLSENNGRDIGGLCELFIPRREVRQNTGSTDRSGKAIYAVKKVSAVQIIEDRQSRIDTAFDSIIQSLAAFADAKTCRKPAWFREDTKTISRWRSPGRLVVLYWSWKNKRFSGDGDVFQGVAEWFEIHRKAHRDLGRFRVRIERHREDFYRRIARRLSEKYETCFVDNTEWSELLKDTDSLSISSKKKKGIRRDSDGDRDSVEIKAEAARKSRIQRAKRKLLKSAAPSRFKAILKEAFGESRYREVELGKPKCIRCGCCVKIERGGLAVCIDNCSGDNVGVDVLTSSVINLYRDAIKAGG